MAAQLPLGRMRLVALQDGHFSPPADYMIPAWDHAVVDATAAGVDDDGRLYIPLGCYLVDSPAGPVLVDSGGGPNDVSPDPFTTGALPTELAGIGVEPADIVAVIHSHLHFDHWGGDVDSDGRSAFPNATIFLSAAELEWGRAQDGVRDRFLPLGDQIETIDADRELFPGIATVATPGHTPGHLAVALDGGAEQALVIGDVAHHPVQLAHPDWGVRFDTDSAAAAATRRETFERIADRDEILVGGHWPVPGWGRVVTRDGARAFEPLEG